MINKYGYIDVVTEDTTNGCWYIEKVSEFDIFYNESYYEILERYINSYNHAKEYTDDDYIIINLGR